MISISICTFSFRLSAWLIFIIIFVNNSPKIHICIYCLPILGVRIYLYWFSSKKLDPYLFVFVFVKKCIFKYMKFCICQKLFVQIYLYLGLKIIFVTNCSRRCAALPCRFCPQREAPAPENLVGCASWLATMITLCQWQVHRNGGDFFLNIFFFTKLY